MNDTVDIIDLKNAIEDAVGVNMGDWDFFDDRGGQVLQWDNTAFQLEGMGYLPEELEPFMQAKHTACEQDFRDGRRYSRYSDFEEFEFEWFCEDEACGHTLISVEARLEGGRVYVTWEIGYGMPWVFRREVYTVVNGKLVAVK